MSISLQSLIDDVRVMSGLRQNPFFSDDQISVFLTDANQELHDLIMKTNEHHLMTSVDFTLLGGNGVGNDTFVLPDGFIQGHSVDMNPDTQNIITVPYLPNWLDRNKNKLAYVPRYFFRAGKLVMYPANRAAGNYRLWYTPRADTLVLPITVDFVLTNSDDPSVPPVGLLAGTGSWQLANAAFTHDIPEDETVDLNLVFQAPNTGFTGAYPILQIGLVSEGYGAPTASCNNLTSTSGFTGPAVGTGNYTYQPIGTVSTMPDVTAPYAQYLKLHASIAIRQGRELNEDDLVRKMDKYTAGLISSITNRAEEPVQPPLTRNLTDWYDDASSTIEWAR